MTLTLFIYLLAIACWLGGMVFFSLFTAPVIFRLLPRAEAGTVVAGLFPRYYLLGYIAGGIALVLACYFGLARPGRLWWGLVALALAISRTARSCSSVLLRASVA